MNARRKHDFRAMAIGTLFAIGIATTIATGGGGSDDGSTPPPPPPSGLLQITAANAHDVSSTLIIALGLSFDIGDITGGELASSSAASPPLSIKTLRIDDLAKLALAYPVSILDDCVVSGTVDITAVLANPNTLTVGDRITAVFADCDDGEGYVISGEVDLTVNAIQGDFLTGVFLLGLDVVMTDVEITEGMDTVAVDGDFMLTLDSLDFPLIAQTIGGSELVLAAAGEVITLTGFDHFIEVDTGAFSEPFRATVSGRMDSLVLGGAVDYETPVDVQASGDDDPYTGEILVTGASNSSVRIVINDSSSVTLEVDTNGDGVVDDYIETNFAALNGHTSTVNSSTARVIGREVLHAVTGFGSLAVTPGGQFVPTAPFGQIQLQAVSGDFDPIELACPAGGTVFVSGSIATAGTFSAGDMLVAAYNACARGGETLNGAFDMLVSSYDQTPGDAYVVAGTVTEAGLDRDAMGLIYNGVGTLDITHDYRYTSTGFTYLTASSQSFTVNQGGVDRHLGGANVYAEITLGPPPLTIVRESSGSLASPALSGDFVYQSIVPDTFLFDPDPATGPYSGELLVTADDGSTLRIVAIDEYSVRLLVDYEGDLVVDTQLQTTWAELLL